MCNTKKCESCLYRTYMGNDIACYHYIDTGKHRVEEGNKCLSYKKGKPRRKPEGGNILPQTREILKKYNWDLRFSS